MSKILVINGSPNMEKGNTSMILRPFVEGMEEAGADVTVLYAKQLDVAPCRGEFHCWYRKPGECIIEDGMRTVYEALKTADTLVIATPVYAPLPGELQNVLNRLMPVIEPVIRIRDGRMRARCHREIALKRVLAVTTGGWWEKENSDVVLHIIREMAMNCGIEFAGAIVRPHADMMVRGGKPTKAGQSILNALHEAGSLFIKDGQIPHEMLDAIGRPLIGARLYAAGLNHAYYRS